MGDETSEGTVRQLRHPFTKATYEWADDGYGPVEVTTAASSGRFDNKGRWVAGSLRYADPEMCRWIAMTGPTRGWHPKQAVATTDRMDKK